MQAKTSKILETSRSRRPCCSICGASAGLARAGIWITNPYQQFSRVFAGNNHQGAVFHQNQLLTAGNVITASSTAPLEFAYHIFKSSISTMPKLWNPGMDSSRQVMLSFYAATTGNLIHLITILSTIHSIRDEVELESVENAVAHQ